MVRPNPAGGRSLKRCVSVVIRLVDLVDERRPLSGTGSPLSMTTETVRFEEPFALLDIGWGRSGLLVGTRPTGQQADHACHDHESEDRAWP